MEKDNNWMGVAKSRKEPAAVPYFSYTKKEAFMAKVHRDLSKNY